MKLKDINCHEMNACDVFAICIEYIKNKAFKRLSQLYNNVKEEQIHWMITVPAIWCDTARHFMIDAAEKVRKIHFCVLCCR